MQDEVLFGAIVFRGRPYGYRVADQGPAGGFADSRL